MMPQDHRITYEKTSVKDPPHSLMLLGKTSGDWYVLTVGRTYFAAPAVNFFFWDFKNMTGKGTSTNSGGHNSLIQKL